MKTIELKVARIGNSRGVRLPAATLRRYSIGHTLVMEERTDGILLHPQAAAKGKLSWEDTAREMAASREDWAHWDAADADGLESAPWQHKTGTVEEQRAAYVVKSPRPAKGRVK